MQPHVTRAALEIKAATHILHRLVTRAGARSYTCVLRNRDLVIDCDISHVHVVDANTVSGLVDGGIPFEFLHISTPVPHQPGIAHVNLAGNGNRTGGTATHNNVPGVRKNLDADWPQNLISALKRALNRSRS